MTIVCDLALSLVFDVSSSMDQAEFRMMRDGVAAALLDPEVPFDRGNVLVQVVDFGETQAVVVPWTPATDREAIAQALSGAPRAKVGGMTGTGRALAFVASSRTSATGNIL